MLTVLISGIKVLNLLAAFTAVQIRGTIMQIIVSPDFNTVIEKCITVLP